MQMVNWPPLPFNPFPELPLYQMEEGVYVYDDRAAALREQRTEGGAPGSASANKSGVRLAGGPGSGAQSMSGPTPPGCCGGGGGGSTNIFCDGPTNFTVAYAYSTNDLWLKITRATNNVAQLVIHTPTTNAFYDVFGTTNLNSLALPQWSKTNWVWLLRAAGGPANFLWTNLTPCAAWFELGTMLDGDADGLPTAYENLVSHTLAGDADTDDDGLSDGWEVLNGLNPLVDDSAQGGSRANFTYDGAGRLRLVTGVRSKSLTLDAEGNVLQASP